MKIAVDFDGTIVTHEYPKIGKINLFAFETLKELKAQGDTLILWTFRSGKYLDEAVAFCKEHGFEFHAVNSNFKNEKFDGTFSRKLNAEIFIDDRNIGGFPGWDVVWKILKKDSGIDPLNSDGIWREEFQSKKKKKFLGIF